MSKGPGRVGTRVGSIRDWLGRQTDSWVGRLAFLWFRRYMQASKNCGGSLMPQHRNMLVQIVLASAHVVSLRRQVCASCPLRIFGQVMHEIIAERAPS